MVKKCVVAWDEKNKVLVFPPDGEGKTGDRSSYARGLTKSLSAEFVPEFSISLVMRDLEHARPKKRGRFKGNLADKQLSLWANEGILPPPHKDQDDRFGHIRNVIINQRWIPVSAQLPVGCKELRLATKIDLVCKDMEGRIILVELKCGFDDYFDVHNQGFMSYPFNELPTSCRHKTVLQLLLTTYLFFHTEHRFSNFPFLGSYTLHIFEKPDGTMDSTLKPLPFWAFSDPEVLQQALLLLKKSRYQNNKKRKQIMNNGSRRVRRRVK